ncbi:MAG TPA: aminotransferase class I/II-fold pyridoxal phosphate-dependent enzyme [Chloroflexota bacterium]|jgi:aminotransferase|nr:aminotransferase class I/II-fold pyridoxal phosphate-dependent enzyme [Chloroflexota bacterium]
MSKATERQAIAQRVRAIPASGIRRYFDLVSTIPDVISLGVGEPDFSTPERVSAAAGAPIARADFAATHYSSNYGLLSLRVALAHHLERRYGVAYDPSCELLITVGVSEALDLAARAIIDPGDEVIIPEPSYVSYIPCTVLAGGVPVMVPSFAAQQFEPDPAAIAAAITPRTKAILLGYPNNPTGAVATRETLQRIVQIAEEHDLTLISDEIYDRLVYGGEHVCLSALPGARERTILLGGFSKAYAMTGWRVGYAAARAEILEAMMKVHQYVIMCAPSPAQMAAEEALKSAEDDVLRMVAEYDRRRHVLVDGLNRIGLSCFEPRGAFYAFPDISSTGLSADEFAEGLLRQEHVLVVPGEAFGPAGAGHVRCCYATGLPLIEQALTRIERFVRRMRG